MGFLFKNRIWFRLLRRKFRHFEENYAINTLLEADFDGFITGQRRCPAFSVGFAKMGDVGCEIAAVYNAFKLLDINSSVSEIIRDFERFGYIMRGKRIGDFGTDTYAIGEYLEFRKLDFKRYKDFHEFSSSAEGFKNHKAVFIMSFWNTDKVWNGYHTVAFRSSDDCDKFIFYNLHGNHRFSSECENLDFVTTGKRFILGYVLKEN